MTKKKRQALLEKKKANPHIIYEDFYSGIKLTRHENGVNWGGSVLEFILNRIKKQYPNKRVLFELSEVKSCSFSTAVGNVLVRVYEPNKFIF